MAELRCPLRHTISLIRDPVPGAHHYLPADMEALADRLIAVADNEQLGNGDEADGVGFELISATENLYLCVSCGSLILDEGGVLSSYAPEWATVPAEVPAPAIGKLGPPAPDMVIKQERGTLIREGNIALTKEEWEVADFFLDRGHEILAINPYLPGIAGRASPDFLIKGFGAVDVLHLYNTDAATLYRAVRKRLDRTRTLFVWLDEDGIFDRSQLELGLAAMWIDPTCRTIDRVILAQEHELLADIGRPQTGSEGAAR